MERLSTVTVVERVPDALEGRERGLSRIARKANQKDDSSPRRLHVFKC